MSTYTDIHTFFIVNWHTDKSSQLLNMNILNLKAAEIKLRFSGANLKAASEILKLQRRHQLKSVTHKFQ